MTEYEKASLAIAESSLAVAETGLYIAGVTAFASAVSDSSPEAPGETRLSPDGGGGASGADDGKKPAVK